MGKAAPTFLKPDDILFIARGRHNYALLVDDQARNLQAVAAPHFYIIKANTKLILPEFLVWLLNQSQLQQYFQREAEGTSAKSIRRNVLINSPIALPSLEKQHKISQLVSTLKQEQEILQGLIKNRNKMMKGIASQLFNGQYKQGKNNGQ